MIPNTINIACYPEEKKFDCEGIIAVGENVKLVFSAPEGFESSEGMVVRVFCGSPNHKLLTMFPLGEEDNWSLIDGKLNCIANFNTIQLHEYVNEFMPDITYLSLELSNEKDGEQTLLCSDFIRVKQWDRVSEETPVDISNLIKTYKDHAHTGEDGTKKISHNSLNDIGTKSHLQIEQELQELNSTTNLLTTNVNKINNQVSSLGATVGAATNQFLENKNEHLNFSKNIDETNKNVNDLSKKVTDTANNLQSKLDENSQEVENVKNKNYLQKTIADGLYLTIEEYDKKVHCNILAPVKTINDLPSISDSEIGDIRLVLDDNMAYVRYYDDDGSGVNGWASLGIGMEELRKLEQTLKSVIASGDKEVLEQVKKLISKVLTYKGSVEKYTDLPASDNVVGDVWNVIETGMNYAYAGDGEWDALGGIIEVTADMVKINLPSYNKLSDWASAVDYFMGQLPSSDSIKKAMSDSENHINNTSNPHRVTPEQIGALPTVDGVAENLKKKNVTDTKTISFSWGTGSHGTIKAVFDEYGNLNDGLILDIGGNWVRNPQENLSMYYYGSVSGLREDLTWYNASCSDYVYPDENASEDNYNYAYNFYLGYDESNGSFVEVAFEMFVSNEETGETGYEYIVKLCNATPWEDVIINSSVLSEYDLLDENRKIKSEFDLFSEWKNSPDIALGQNARLPSSGGNVSIGKDAFVEREVTDSVCIGKESRVKANQKCCTLIGAKSDVYTYYGVVIGYESSIDSYSDNSIAIGYQAIVPGNTPDCVQLGTGTNSNPQTLQFRSYTLVDANGHIPAERIIETDPEFTEWKNNTVDVVIGAGATVNSSSGSVVIGNGAIATGSYVVVLGRNAKSAMRGVAVGMSALAEQSSGVSIGNSAKARGYGAIAIGTNSEANGGTAFSSIAIGEFSKANAKYAIGIGYYGRATAENAVQIGNGTNANANTLQFRDFTVIDADGYIPMERIALVSPSGKKFKLVVSDEGVLSTEEIVTANT